MSLLKHSGLVSVMLWGMASPASAQATFSTYGVADWSSVVPEKRVEFQSYRTIILSNGTLDDDEKARRIAVKFSDIQKAVRAARMEAYEAVRDSVGVGNSATKGSSGGSPKVSDAKCRGSDLPGMYTTAEWVKGAYQSGGAAANSGLFQTGHRVSAGDILIENGAKICAIRLKQSGRGRKVAYSQGAFRIRPAEITRLVAAELTPIMTEISRSPL